MEGHEHDDFQILCGIEEEFLIINEDGKLVKVADDLMKVAARFLRRNSNLLDSLMLKISGLDAEPNPAQIEYVTLPLHPSDLEDAVRAGRELLISAATELGVKILAQSLHPIQSVPNPIAGTHINVSVKRKGSLMTPEQLRLVNNYLWNHLPEIIAITSNSPVYKGVFNDVIGNRYRVSSVLKMTGPAKIEKPDYTPALIPIHYYGRQRYKLRIGIGEDEFLSKVVTNRRGDRLVDITPRGPLTNISDDKDDSPARSRVEVRAIDVQQDVNKLIKISHLICASALHAVLHEDRNISLDPNHEENVNRAYSRGRGATFLNADGRDVALVEKVQDWVRETADCQEFIGFPLNDGDVKVLLSGPIQSKLEVHHEIESLEALRRHGNLYVIVKIKDTRIVKDDYGREYTIPKGTTINGLLSTDYKLEFEEEDGMVSRFTTIKAYNFLDVHGLHVPLKKNDTLIKVVNEYEYLLNRLLSPFSF
ncbi:MAG: hypothetical protein ACTSWN_12115 [Promethearchaeota archaeon]